MKVSLKCFATLAEGQVCDFRGADQHEISDGETVRGLVNKLGMPEDEIRVVFVNNKVTDLDAVLSEGDQVALSPPVGGM